MKNIKAWHRAAFIVVVVLAVTSWFLAFYYWDKLPNIIPTHFGWNGQADDWNNKSLFYVFLLPGMQTLMLGLFGFTYWKPQYSDMPTTLWLMAMEKHKREHAFELIRTMIVGISLWIGLLFTYMTYAMNASALDKSIGMNPSILFGIIGFMLVWLVWWTVKVYKTTKPLIMEMMHKEK